MRIVITKNPAATLYMYDRDSMFNIIMNSYMSDGAPIVPDNNGDQTSLLGNGSLNLPSLSQLANMTRTLSPSEYKLLDSM